MLDFFIIIQNYYDAFCRKIFQINKLYFKTSFIFLLCIKNRHQIKTIFDFSVRIVIFLKVGRTTLEKSKPAIAIKVTNYSLQVKVILPVAFLVNVALLLATNMEIRRSLF